MTIIDSILNSDDYQRGYHEGYSDGLNGKERNNFRKGLSMGLSMKFAIHGRNALETFSKGYEEGYRKGIEDRHSKAQPQKVEVVKQTKDSNSQNGNKSVFNTYQTSKSMASLQDYQIQLEQLNELVRFLNQFKDEMNDKLNSPSSVFCLYSRGSLFVVFVTVRSLLKSTNRTSPGCALGCIRPPSLFL